MDILRKRMVTYLKPGYKTSTNTVTSGVSPTGAVNPRGTVDHIEHWSGRVDAVAKPKALPMKLTSTLGAPLSPWHLKAVGEHQKALDELRLARAAGMQPWIDACLRRVNEWQARILETQ